ncbi:SprT-like family-domain-containing protein [Pseudomassariella vexata]|uniref:SprT-like family-domain-containing protein n=1 Tax=Pseudomassariella vexata TaxID=1141098 RepID=A0A1Y2DNB2_9PEZI|nr:SprT-like family-domain-containing protein [Pseudomassariella vexata]ORY60727.1 SprT-like family-domain-containing protein [Pseudomassariella vexata]
MDESDDEKPDTKPDLCPITPKKTLVLSPEKAPRIPMSPWKPEHKEFWDPEVQNKWIDQHSPAKPSRTKPVAGTKDIKVNLKEKYGTSPKKRDAKKTFDQTKDALAQRFLHELDERITAGKLTKLTASTGGIRTQWSTSLQSTAGRAHWKCKEVVTMTQLPDGSVSSVQERQHHAFIELASKVLTTEDNLLNTVAHEFCHLATFMLDGKPKFAHGAEFKAWGKKCMDVFGDRGVVVTTKHSYEIDYKYIWRCVECTTEVHRHSKSVDPVKQRCGRCRGSLEQVKPVPRGGGQGKKSAYQEFVSKEMKVLKAEGQKLSFKDMMTTVASRWKTRQQEGKGPSPELETKEVEKKFEKLTVVDIVSD